MFSFDRTRSTLTSRRPKLVNKKRLRGQRGVYDESTVGLHDIYIFKTLFVVLKVIICFVLLVAVYSLTSLENDKLANCSITQSAMIQFL